jgi:hypothetical protein
VQHEIFPLVDERQYLSQLESFQGRETIMVFAPDRPGGVEETHGNSPIK